MQPIRFVRACRFGHIDDLNWKELVHGGEACTKARPMYWIDEAGTSGDLADVRVTCDCGKSLRMSVAAERSFENPPLGWCDGKRPWLGDAHREIKVDHVHHRGEHSGEQRQREHEPPHLNQNLDPWMRKNWQPRV